VHGESRGAVPQSAQAHVLQNLPQLIFGGLRRAAQAGGDKHHQAIVRDLHRTDGHVYRLGGGIAAAHRVLVRLSHTLHSAEFGRTGFGHARQRGLELRDQLLDRRF
jgi:hypothetical protein